MSDPVPPPPPPPPTPGPTPPPPPGAAAAITPDERTWGTMAHIASIIASFLGGFSPLGPLIVWLVKKDESAFVAHHGREALNFQIGVFIVAAILFVAGFCTFGIGWFLLPLVGLVSIIFSIIGAVKANEGLLWRYPVSIRFVN